MAMSTPNAGSVMIVTSDSKSYNSRAASPSFSVESSGSVARNELPSMSLLRIHNGAGWVPRISFALNTLSFTQMRIGTSSFGAAQRLFICVITVLTPATNKALHSAAPVGLEYTHSWEYPLSAHFSNRLIIFFPISFGKLFPMYCDVTLSFTLV